MKNIKQLIRYFLSKISSFRDIVTQKYFIVIVWILWKHELGEDTNRYLCHLYKKNDINGASQ